MKHACPSKTYLLLKRLLDIICALLGLILTLPIWLLTVIGIEFSDAGPVFYLAKRVGKGNHPFQMYKFRSMRQGKANEAVFRGDEDRIFPFGRFIRATKIDELPQLLNILLGDMSLVGTRPPTVDEWDKYKYHHRARLAFKPGITGLWQVSGRSKITDFEEVVALDLKYINTWTIAQDIVIILKTVQVLFTGDGAR